MFLCDVPFVNSSNNESLTVDVSPLPTLPPYVYVTCAPLSICLNFIVLFIAWSKVSFFDAPCQYFVVLMTASDFTFAVVYMATYMIFRCFPTILCGVYYSTTWCCQILSVIGLLYLNIDKFISLSQPLHYPQMVTQKRARLITIITVTLVAVFSTITFAAGEKIVTYNDIYHIKTGHFKRLISQCFITLNPHYYFAMISGLYVVPIALSLAISIYIFRLAHRIASLDHQPKSTTMRRVAFVFSSTVWTAITSLPYRLNYCIVSLCRYIACQDNPYCPTCTTDWLLSFGHYSMLLVPLGSMVNPLITLITQRTYYEAVKQYLRRCCAKRSHMELRSWGGTVGKTERSVYKLWISLIKLSFVN